jgi:DNA-binding transcriptional LysR family regulator
MSTAVVRETRTKRVSRKRAAGNTEFPPVLWPVKNDERAMVTADILLFVRVAETLSFKEAAQQLRLSPSQASKRIASLEEELHTRLIYRSPRSISLTSAGETLLAHYRRIYDMVEEARVAVEHLNNEPLGRLRFSVPTCLGAALLPALYRDFSKRYPGIMLDAHTSERCVDIVAGGYDVVIRVAQKLTDSSLTARRLATSQLVVAAAPSYLAERGIPTHPTELSQHSCLGLATAKQQAVWQFRTPNGRLSVPVAWSAVSDNNLALVVAACAGLGLLYVPQAVIANELRQGALQQVLGDFCTGIEWGVYAMYYGRTPTRSAAVFIDFVREQLPNLDRIERWPTVPKKAVA